MKSGAIWLATAVLLAAGIASAAAQTRSDSGSPASGGITQSSPASPDRPASDAGNGEPRASNPSTTEIGKQPSVGGRALEGYDPAKPGEQGSAPTPGAPLPQTAPSK